MKKLVSILLCIALIFSFSACAKKVENNQDSNQNTQQNTTQNEIIDDEDLASGLDTKILVVYFSCTGNTAQVAYYISEVAGAARAEIIPVKPYTIEDLNWKNQSSRSTLEQNDINARADFQLEIDDVSAFDYIYLGYPIWHNKAPKIIYSFLEKYDFSGKTIVPFCTSGGSTIENSLVELKPLAPNAKWEQGKTFSASTTQQEVVQWLV